MIDIVTLGEILIDMFPAEIGRPLVEVSAFRPKPGGAPANVAVAASRLGAATAFIGKVGDDIFGHHLVDVMGREGVETRGMRVDNDARTTMAIIAMPDEQTAEFVFYRNPGADLRLRIEELDMSLLRDTKVLHIGSLSLVDQPAQDSTYKAVTTAKKHGALISFDVNYRPSLWEGPRQALDQVEGMIPMVDLVKVNEVELALLDRGPKRAAAINSILDQGPSICVLTLGQEGSYVQTADGAAMVPAFAVETVDATGCGDSFIAALLTRLTRGSAWREPFSLERLQAALRYANAAGAVTAQTQGTIPAMPTAAQVESFLAMHE